MAGHGGAWPFGVGRSAALWMRPHPTRTLQAGTHRVSLPAIIARHGAGKSDTGWM